MQILQRVYWKNKQIFHPRAMNPLWGKEGQLDDDNKEGLFVGRVISNDKRMLYMLLIQIYRILLINLS